MAWRDGTRWIAATAHQNEHWPEVTPERIVESTEQVARELRGMDLPMALRPAAEVMISHDTVDRWCAGELLSVANQEMYLIVEFPHGLYLDLRELVPALTERGVRPILAHPERHPELLHDAQRIDQLIGMGCLVQISSSSVTDAADRETARALKRWLRRGVAHLIGSDGHSPHGRPPRLGQAYRTIARLAGTRAADRICSTNGLAVLQGLPLNLPQPEREKRTWFRIG